MSEPVRVCAVSDVAVGQVLAARVEGVPVAVVHADDGAFYAVHDECSHAAVALSEGEVDGHAVECWMHGARFDLRTGVPANLPATKPIAVYAVEVRDGDVYVSPGPSDGVPPVSEEAT